MPWSEPWRAMEPRLLPPQPPPRNSLARHAATWRRTLSTAREPPPGAPRRRRGSCPARASNIGHMRRLPPPSFNKAFSPCNLSTPWGRAALEGHPIYARRATGDACCICLDAWSSRDDHCDMSTTADSAAAPRRHGMAWQFGRVGVLVCDCQGAVGRFAWGWCRERGGNRTTEPPNHRTTKVNHGQSTTTAQHPPRVKCKCPSRHPTRIGLPSHDSHWLACWPAAVAAVPSIWLLLDYCCRVASRASVVVESSGRYARDAGLVWDGGCKGWTNKRPRWELKKCEVQDGGPRAGRFRGPTFSPSRSCASALHGTVQGRDPVRKETSYSGHARIFQPDCPSPGCLPLFLLPHLSMKHNHDPAATMPN
ncbi:hypothetical protein QBC39DRAFT_27553 [Podospora conica]|nr:hypothetical protein QBC39DRAFT_27553 [Schizothecium conicum]